MTVNLICHCVYCWRQRRGILAEWIAIGRTETPTPTLARMQCRWPGHNMNKISKGCRRNSTVTEVKLGRDHKSSYCYERIMSMNCACSLVRLLSCFVEHVLSWDWRNRIKTNADASILTFYLIIIGRDVWVQWHLTTIFINSEKDAPRISAQQFPYII